MMIDHDSRIPSWPFGALRGLNRGGPKFKPGQQLHNAPSTTTAAVSG